MIWCHTYILGTKCLWTYKVQPNASWTWLKIMKMREWVQPLIRYRVGNGRDIFIWHDSWHKEGLLVKKFGRRIIYDAVSTNESMIVS